MAGAISEPSHALLVALEDNDLWMKESAAGPDSLVRAISAALFLSELRAPEVQKQLDDFLTASYKRLAFRFSRHFSLEQLRRDYLTHPSRPEFEGVTLELATHLFHCRFKLYSSLGQRLSCEIYPHVNKKSVRIVRAGPGHYAALFPKSTLEAATICQQFVLKLVDDALGGSGQPRNGTDQDHGAFINYDLARFQKERQPQSYQAEKSRYSRGHTHPSDAPTEERPLWVRDAGENESVGKDILQMIKNRKSKSHQQKEENHRNFMQSFVDPITFFETLQLHMPEASGILSANSDDSFEDYLKTFQEENEKLNVDVDLELVSNSLAPTGQKSTVSTQGDDPANDKDLVLLQIQKAREPQPSLPQITVPNSFANIDALDWTNDANGPTQAPKNTLKQKLKQKKNPLQEFVPSAAPAPLHQPAPTAVFTPFQPEATDFSHRFADANLYPSSAPPPGTHSPPKSVMCVKPQQGYDTGLKDRYIEMIDPILYEGRLKFFDEKNGYGFILVKDEGMVQDLFVYRSEFERAKVPMDSLRQVKNGLQLFFSFQIARYTTKGQASKKAINLRMIRRLD